jgi:hypothetical protein
VSKTSSPGTGWPICTREGTPFVLESALYMKAIYAGKAKNDTIDTQKIAVLLRGACSPRPMAIPRRCGPPASSCGGGCL